MAEALVHLGRMLHSRKAGTGRTLRFPRTAEAARMHMAGVQGCMRRMGVEGRKGVVEGERNQVERG